MHFILNDFADASFSLQYKGFLEVSSVVTLVVMSSFGLCLARGAFLCPLFWLGLHGSERTLTWSSLGKERVHLALRIGMSRRGRSLNQEPNQKTWRRAAYWFSSSAAQACLPSPIHSVLALLLAIRKMPRRHAQRTGSSWQARLAVMSPLTPCQLDIQTYHG